MGWISISSRRSRRGVSQAEAFLPCAVVVCSRSGGADVILSAARLRTKVKVTAGNHDMRTARLHRAGILYGVLQL